MCVKRISAEEIVSSRRRGLSIINFYIGTISNRHKSLLALTIKQEWYSVSGF